MKVLEIVLPVPVNKYFYYTIPEQLKNEDVLFKRVKVPFNNKVLVGFCLSIQNDFKSNGKIQLKNILEVLDEYPILTKEVIEMSKWLSETYLCSFGEALATVVPVSLTIPKSSLKLKKTAVKTQVNNIKLNSYQETACNKIFDAIDKNKNETFLLHGVTGSGKTEVYLNLIDRVIKENKTAIVLVPEISLTPQITDRFLARFGRIIAILHSKLSNGERFDEWNRIREGRAKIVIGARSAIFAPISNLGLIIIDEAHDNSYKSDMTPRYHAKDLAKYIAKQNNIPLILGSATPDVCDYYKALKHDMELVCLTKRANNATLPNIEVVDMRQELSFGNRSMFSLKLQEKIKENLEKRKQTILFINRRGYSTFIMCRDCGYVVKCPNCNIALTYHSYGNRLKCHYCGHEENLVRLCPECGSKRIKYFGSGTQKVEDEISKLFPKASTIRMDIDTVSKKNSHEDILNKFKNENIDILIGTQMIVKRTSFS